MEWLWGVIARLLGPYTEQREIDKLNKVITAKEKKIEDLEGQLVLREKLHFQNGMYRAKEDSGVTEPYCSRCYDDKDKQLIHLHKQENGYWCPKCHTFIQTGYLEPVNPYKSYIDY